MIDAAESIATSGGLETGILIVAAVADEEYASVGADALVKNWRADAVVVTEPTDLMIAIGHKGFSWVEVTTHGRAAHGSRPEEGRDAILMMGRVLGRLEECSRQLSTRPAEPTLGNPSLHASLIEGGKELSTYPDRCLLKLERRTVVGESRDVALQEVEAILLELHAEDPDFKAAATMLFDRSPYLTPTEHPLPAMMEHLVESATSRKAKRTAMTFWTDAAILGLAGIPSVIFGPGGEGLHGLEEYVRIDEVLLCRDILASLAREYC